MILQGDVLEQLATLADESVHCVVTSPPYWGLRDYGIDGQLGVEKTPEEYIEKMVMVFREIWRVLRKDGTLWLNMGDSYAANRTYQVTDGKHIDVGNTKGSSVPLGFKPKDLIGMPWRLALALQADSWWLRSDVIEEVELYCPCGCGYVLQERIWRYGQDRAIVWKKPNPMPEAVTDRPTSSHEYIFLLAKAARYFYDQEAIREPHISTDQKPRSTRKTGEESCFKRQDIGREFFGNSAGRNMRDVWTIATQPYLDAHFATFPEKLVQRCILAGTSAKGCCPECGAPWVRVVEKPKSGSWHDHSENLTSGARQSTGGPKNNYETGKTTGWRPSCECDAGDPVPATVLDPFLGSGTTGKVAQDEGRDWIGIELNADYCKLAEKRTRHRQEVIRLG